MLYTLAVIMLIMWLFALASSFTMGGMIHLLPVVAIVAIVVRIMGKQNVFSAGK